MATYQALDINARHRHVGPFGDATMGHGTVTPGAATDGDFYQPVRVPGGLEVTALVMTNEAIDTGAALDVEIGYHPVGSTPVADGTYFSAEVTTLQAIATTRFEAFAPKRFEEDVFVTVEVTTTAATFAAGIVRILYEGINHGVK